MAQNNDKSANFPNAISNGVSDTSPTNTNPVSMLEAALSYHAAGHRVIPFWNDPEPKKQFPPWAKYRDGQTIEDVKRLFSKPCDRLAILTGIDGLEALDFDLKHDPTKTIYNDFITEVGKYPELSEVLKKTPIVRTKAGGWHILYRAGNIEGNTKLTMRKGSPEAVIETRGIGGLLFVAPSPGYELVQGSYLSIPTITEKERDDLILVARLLSHREEVGNDAGRPGDEFNKSHSILDLLEPKGWASLYERNGIVYLNRPGAPHNGVSAAILKTANGERFFPFTTSTHYAANQCYSAFAVYAHEEHKGDYKAAAKALAPKGSTPGSSSQSDGGVKGSTSGNGSQSDVAPKVENSYTKIVSYLNEHYKFKFDVVSNELFARKKNDDGSWGAYGVLNENNILHELRQGGIKVSDSVLLSLLGSDYVKRHDPFVEYFKNLPPYDQSEGDHILKAASYVRLKDESEREFFNKMYKKTLVRIAAAATLKISFNKQCFVFSGGQGGGKSTYVRWHCPLSLSAYRVDWTREEVNEKDGRFALAQNFMINLDELASFGKHNIEQTKALMSLDHIKDRPPYGKRPVRMPRRASFWGSTNRLEFLTDETGTRRWITFEIESIKHDSGGPDGYAANVDIDRVWAQAWHLLESGEVAPELTEEETEKSESKNKFFAVSTFELEMLMKHFEEADSEGLGVQFCLTADIQKQLADITSEKINRLSLTAAIKRLGWQLRSKRLKGKDYPIKGYFVRKLDIPGSAFEVEQSKPNEVGNENVLPDEPPF